MFLSTENPPNDPLSSSSNLLHLTSSSHDLAQSHLSNFSIRDYAYSNRKTNIKNNWPFSPKSLHLFSTHGVNDPLPPFQRFSTDRNQFETSSSSGKQKQIVSYVHRGSNQTIAAAATETSKRVCSKSKTVENGLLFPSTSVSSKPRVEIVASKKCGRGMVKSKEDGCGGLVTSASESMIMASKTCPICRTFSSASNTTLNAHIDQCLSVDSEPMPLVISKPNKPRVKSNTAHINQCVPPVVSSNKPNRPRGKPRMKVKTMVDIYASAKRCTLEDLDKRNGTKWVSILSYTNRSVADKSAEMSKKRKVPPVGVGPVYIDDKGQKLRILSEFGEKKTSTSMSREQHVDNSSNEKKCNSRSSRKNHRGKKPHKFVKITNHKTNASEIPVSGEGSSKGHRRIYNQRMLAKRSLISKKLNEKGHKFYASRDQPSETDDDDSMSGGDPTVLRITDSYRLNKQKLGSKNATLFESKKTQSRSFRVQTNEKEEESFERVHTNTLRLKKSFATIQEDKYPPRKRSCSDAVEVSDASRRGANMRTLPPQFVANSWRRLSMPAEVKKVRLDFSEKDDEDEDEDEEDRGKWESEMTQERVLSDDDYISGDDGQTDEVLLRTNPSFGDYDDYNDDDEEESSEEEEEDNVKRDKTDEFYESDTPPSIEIVPSERAMYYSEEVGDMIYGQTEEDMRFDSNVGQQGSLFVEVDTIPIPGPPGSFLPSPRDMGFDENLGNSSVITSQLDRNSSESPVSAVSNFASGRLNFPAESSSSFRENEIPVSYSSSFRVPSHHGTITEAEPITNDKTIPLSRFINDDNESCCCQRKEGIITLNHQASHLLQRRAASSSTKSPTSLDPNHAFEQQPPHTIQQDLVDHQSRTNVNGVVPPSPSNPVLRLMGKDLMVMNQGEADEGASLSSLKPPSQLLDHPPAGTGLYFNTGLYLRNSFKSTHQPQAQTQAQASGFRNNFEQVRYFSPS